MLLCCTCRLAYKKAGRTNCGPFLQLHSTHAMLLGRKKKIRRPMGDFATTLYASGSMYVCMVERVVFKIEVIIIFGLG